MVCIITKEEARKAGLKHYFTGKKCKRGHVEKRRVSDSSCFECERVRDEARRAINPERHREQAREWQRNNPERARAKWHKWAAQNPARMAAHYAARYARKINATPKWADLDAIAAVYHECRCVTEKTGVLHHVDHILPLKGKSVCGLHVHWNLRVIPASANRSKGNRLPPPSEWRWVEGFP